MIFLLGLIAFSKDDNNEIICSSKTGCFSVNQKMLLDIFRNKEFVPEQYYVLANNRDVIYSIKNNEDIYVNFIGNDEVEAFYGNAIDVKLDSNGVDIYVVLKDMDDNVYDISIEDILKSDIDVL